MRKSKRQSQQSHLSRRLYERYGIRYSREIESAWIALIRSGNAHLIDKQSNRLSVFQIPVGLGEGQDFINVVYDRSRGSIVTVLHPEGSRV